MALNPKLLKQVAIYWAPASTNRFNEKEYAQPIEIKCRWDESRTTGFDSLGNATVFNAEVFVDRDLEPNGYLMEGTIADLTRPIPPPEAARRIQKFDRFGNFKQTETFRIAMV